MATAIIWGYVIVAILPAQPEQEPRVLFDYPTEQQCLDDKIKLEADTDYAAWCIPVPKPEKEYRRRTRTRAPIHRKRAGLTMTQIVREHGL